MTRINQTPTEISDVANASEALTEAVEASVQLPKPARVRKPKLTIVSARKIAAYRAHRTMVANA